MTEDPFVSVIGLDGATFSVLDGLMENNALPTLAALVSDGVRGTNETCLPMATTPAWRAYSNGTDPSKLGVYNVSPVSIDLDEERIESWLVDSTDYEGKPIWEVLGDAGFKSCIINLHDTVPVTNIEGVMVGEHAKPRPDYVTPTSVSGLLEEFGYEEPNLQKIGDRDEYYQSLLDIIHTRFDLAERILETTPDIDFFHLSIFFIDSIQHEWWNDDERLRNAWVQIDRRLGDLLEIIRSMEREETIFVISDHGHTALKDRIYLNEWLRQKGHLITNADTSYIYNFLYDVGLNRDRIERILRRFRGLSVARKIVPRDIRRRIPDETGETPAALGLVADINVKESKAFTPGGDQIYLLTDDDRVREQLIEDIRSIEHPGTGEPVIKKACPQEVAYIAPDEKTPDIVLEPNDGYRVFHALTEGKAVWDSQLENRREIWKSVHDRHGIFIAQGPNIIQGCENIRIYDLYPTILHIFGVPIPDVTDGQVRKAIFSDDSDPAERQIHFQSLGEDDAQTHRERLEDVKERKERLRELGYLE